MTPQEMNQAKQRLEADLLERIRAFEVQTGLIITHVDCICIATTVGERGIAVVKVRAELP